jgi:hypothetical protein
MLTAIIPVLIKNFPYTTTSILKPSHILSYTGLLDSLPDANFQLASPSLIYIAFCNNSEIIGDFILCTWTRYLLSLPSALMLTPQGS